MMDEVMKEQIVADALKARTYQSEDGIKARYLIKLVRALDSYRERDEKGRFLAVKHGWSSSEIRGE